MRTSLAVTLSGALALGVALSLVATDAGAVPHLKRVGVTGGFAGMAGNEGDFAGYGGGVLGSYGVTDAIAIAGSAFFTSNQVSKTGGRSLVASQALGAIYSLDVIEIVPWFGFYVGLYELGGGGVTKSDVKVGGQLAVGLDYILSRTWIVGLDLRAHALPADFAKSATDPMPFYTTTFVKLEYAWGWF
jgi:hypothetical protein